MGQIFISYLREDRARVLRFVSALKNAGGEVWWDEDNLSLGDHWSKNVNEAIKQSEYFIPYFSSNFRPNTNRTMEKEVLYAAEIYRSKAQNDAKWMLPVKIEQCEMPNISLSESLTIGDLHWVLLDDQNWDGGIKAIDVIVLNRPRNEARSKLIGAANRYHAARIQAATEQAHDVMESTARMIQERARREQSGDYTSGNEPIFRSHSATYQIASLTLEQREKEYEDMVRDFEERFKAYFNPFSEIVFRTEDVTEPIYKEHSRLEKKFEHAELVLMLIMLIISLIAGYFIS